MDLKDIYWLAGIIEGEGCFVIRDGRHLRVQVKMTDEDIVRRCHAVTGLGHVQGPWKNPGGKLPIWGWDVSTRAEAAGLMMTIYPLMGQRRQARIRECLDVWRNAPYLRKVA